MESDFALLVGRREDFGAGQRRHGDAGAAHRRRR